MIKSFFNKIFNIREESSLERPKSFTKIDLGKPISAASPKQMDTEYNMAVCVDLDALFYSLLFSARTKDTGGVANNLERRVMLEIEQALASP